MIKSAPLLALVVLYAGVYWTTFSVHFYNLITSLF